MNSPSGMLWREPFSGPVCAIELVEKAGFQVGSHCHSEAQLMLVVRGFVTCEVALGLWMVPPQCALWVPACMAHSTRGVGDLQLDTVYVDPKLTGMLPQECCVLAVSPLLREIIFEISRLPKHSDADGPDSRLIGIMIDRLATAAVERLHLPMPVDRRLRQIADRLMSDPADRTTIPEWARKVGMSERTLCRQLCKETGMSFGRWRQQFQIMLALDRLAAGNSIQAVAYELGYESSSAFVTMFRKTLGKPPLRFLAERTLASSKLRSNSAQPMRESALVA